MTAALWASPPNPRFKQHWGLCLLALKLSPAKELCSASRSTKASDRQVSEGKPPTPLLISGNPRIMGVVEKG